MGKRLKPPIRETTDPKTWRNQITESIKMVKTLNLQSYEKIIIGERLRHFGTDFENNLFVDNDFFYISADVEGLYKLRFKDFR